MRTGMKRGIAGPDQVAARKAWALLGLVLLLVALPKPSSASQLSAEEVLNKVSEAYRGIRSCRFVAVETAELAANVETAQAASATESHPWSGTRYWGGQKSVETQVELVASLPGKVRLTAKGPKLDLVLSSDGRTTWAYVPRQKQYSEASWVPSQPPDPSRPDEEAEAQILSGYWTLLVDRFRTAWQFAPSAKLEKDSRIKVGRDKVDCYAIRAHDRDASYEMWVDKSRFVVLRFKRTPLPPMEGVRFQWSITVNIVEASVNAGVEDASFKFAAPADAAKVQSLDTSKWQQ